MTHIKDTRYECAYLKANYLRCVFEKAEEDRRFITCKPNLLKRFGLVCNNDFKGVRKDIDGYLENVYEKRNELLKLRAPNQNLSANEDDWIKALANPIHRRSEEVHDNAMFGWIGDELDEKRKQFYQDQKKKFPV